MNFVFVQGDGRKRGSSGGIYVYAAELEYSFPNKNNYVKWSYSSASSLLCSL